MIDIGSSIARRNFSECRMNDLIAHWYLVNCKFVIQTYWSVQHISGVCSRTGPVTAS